MNGRMRSVGVDPEDRRDVGERVRLSGNEESCAAGSSMTEGGEGVIPFPLAANVLDAVRMGWGRWFGIVNLSSSRTPCHATRVG
jgi:hypothetical protein